MVYYGPADEARRHFYDMGYEPAHRQTTADFLVATTDPSGRTERSPGVSIPRTATDFAYHFQKSALAQTNRYNIQSYRNRYVESVNTKHPSPYMISIPMQARAVLIRRIQIFWGMRVSKTVSFLSVSLEPPAKFLAVNYELQFSRHAGYHDGFSIYQAPAYIICFPFPGGHSLLVSQWVQQLSCGVLISCTQCTFVIGPSCRGRYVFFDRGLIRTSRIC